MGVRIRRLALGVAVIGLLGRRGSAQEAAFQRALDSVVRTSPIMRMRTCGPVMEPSLRREQLRICSGLRGDTAVNFYSVQDTVVGAIKEYFVARTSADSLFGDMTGRLSAQYGTAEECAGVRDSLRTIRSLLWHSGRSSVWLRRSHLMTHLTPDINDILDVALLDHEQKCSDWPVLPIRR